MARIHTGAGSRRYSSPMPDAVHGFVDGEDFFGRRVDTASHRMLGKAGACPTFPDVLLGTLRFAQPTKPPFRHPPMFAENTHAGSPPGASGSAPPPVPRGFASRRSIQGGFATHDKPPRFAFSPAPRAHRPGYSSRFAKAQKAPTARSPDSAATRSGPGGFSQKARETTARRDTRTTESPSQTVPPLAGRSAPRSGDPGGDRTHAASRSDRVVTC